MTTTALTASTVEPVTPEYAESLGFVPSYAPGAMFLNHQSRSLYLEFSNGVLEKAYLREAIRLPAHYLPHLPTRYTLAKIVEEFTHKGNG